jgi:phenylalanyl-tRNA synthetase beta chain
MRVSLRWLADYIDLPDTDPEVVAHALTWLGMKVEAIDRIEPDWSGVTVARVEKIAAHPNADKIRLCRVDTGEKSVEVVCGAWNFEEGATVAFAEPGAVLAGGFAIGTREIRGITSNGMICSERELGLGEDHAGILVLEAGTPIGVPFEEVIDLPDTVFDLEITSNRPDLMSMVGVARELAAYYRVPYRMPPTEVDPSDSVTLTTSVRIEDPSGCYRFVARELRGVSVRPSPLRVRTRLRVAGVRPISNIVDVTNYVMIELGQPLHAFDADRLANNAIVVRRARAGERLITLDGVDRELIVQDLLVADPERAQGLAGTMGGRDSEVSDSTKNVVIEAAAWDPPTIGRMSRRLGLRSEASSRFERGVDPNLPPIAAARANRLMMELAGGESPFAAVDVVTRPFSPVSISLPLREVTRLLGDVVPIEEVASLLSRFELATEGDDPLLVTVPTFRRDLERPADLVEEVARLYGYDRFPETLPTGPAGGYTPEQRRSEVLRRTLTSAGLFQAVNLSFARPDDAAVFGDDNAVTVTNPLNDEMSILRTSLLPGLLRSLRYNQNRGTESLGLFEIGQVFFNRPSSLDARIPEQPMRLGLALIGRVGASALGEKPRAVDVYSVTGIWRSLAEALGVADWKLSPARAPGFHPGRTASVSVGGEIIGHLGELHPQVAARHGLSGRVAIGELTLAPLVVAGSRWILEEPSIYPGVDFDLAFIVPADVLAEDLRNATLSASDLVEVAEPFDEFLEVGENSKSLAFHYRLRAPDRTLDSEEIAVVRGQLIEAAAKFGGKLRT